VIRLLLNSQTNAFEAGRCTCARARLLKATPLLVRTQNDATPASLGCFIHPKKRLTAVLERILNAHSPARRIQFP
jgi:hypothetical protein